MKKLRLLFSIYALFACILLSAMTPSQWPSFMSKQDLTWSRLPQAWDEASFMGNGSLGTYICQEPGTNTLRKPENRKRIPRVSRS